MSSQSTITERFLPISALSMDLLHKRPLTGEGAP